MNKESMRGPDQPGRETAEYYEQATFQLPGGPESDVHIMQTCRPPESFRELVQEFEKTRSEDGSEVGEFIELIGLSSDRDKIVRKLPYFFGAVIFILPDF